MAVRASLYLKGELQKEMQKRPNGVSDQIQRLFDCYKYCRRQLAGKFEDAELDLLLYAQKYGEWDDDPKSLYGLGLAIKKALDDRLDALEPHGVAKRALKATQYVLNNAKANNNPFSEEQLAEIQIWSDAIYNDLDENTDIEYMMLSKLSKLHSFDLMTLIDTLEQANKTENPQRTIRYLLPGWERAMEVVRTQKSTGVENTEE